jgi:hypothetical protein
MYLSRYVCVFKILHATSQNGNIVGKIATLSEIIVSPKEPQKEGFLSVFPNPASDNTRVAWNEPLTHDALLQLTNSIGQTVRTIEVEKGGIYKEINLKGLAAGVYFLSLSNGETVKLVKIE